MKISKHFLSATGFASATSESKKSEILKLYGQCAFDDKVDRVLDGYFETSEEMTIEQCLGICSSKGFRYAGLEWALECHCGNEPEGGFEWAWPDKCDDTCSGNDHQICGGKGAMRKGYKSNRIPSIILPRSR